MEGNWNGGGKLRWCEGKLEIWRKGRVVEGFVGEEGRKVLEELEELG